MKQRLQRLLLKDINWNIFRICSFWFWLDKYNEEYIKFNFPDLKWTPLFYNSIESKNHEEQLINEFSVHIQWWISHFKSSNQKRFYKKETKLYSKYKEFKIIHLFSYTIYDLNHFKFFNKKQTKLDYFLKEIFDKKKWKILEFYLTKVDKKVIIPNIDYNNLERKMYHSLLT
jgi:hypothetical protein